MARSLLLRALSFDISTHRESHGVYHCLTCKPRPGVRIAFSRWIDNRTYLQWFAKIGMHLIC